MAAFSPISAQFIPFSEAHQDDNEALTVFDCWTALHNATNKGWLDFNDVPGQDAIDMQEHLHYDSAANGKLHVVVPDKLIAFPCPADLTADRDWVDEAGARRFSAAYYAEILSDFDVAVVVCCAGPNGDLPYDPAALATHGAAVEVLRADLRCRGLLASIDRLVTLARTAPGAVALQGLGAWEEGLLLSACLIRLHGFSAREALAWARMAHPPDRPTQPVLELHLATTSIGPAAGPEAIANE
jgi:hypothetical protein